MTEINTLRLNDIKLPLDHGADDLRAAVLALLQIADTDLLDVQMYKRSYDARKKSDIQLIYSLDVHLTDTAHERVLAAFSGSQKVLPSPDTEYKFPECTATAPNHYWFRAMRHFGSLGSGTNGL